MLRKRPPRSVLALVVAVVMGCNGGSRDGVVPVSGRVTYDGKPVTEGRVIFYPVDDRRMAMGPIDGKGYYVLTTFKDNDGAYPGKHVVVIDAVREVGAAPASIDEEVGSAAPTIVRLVPEKYADPRTSDLEAEVQDRDNTIDFAIPR
jgi:hypothetical protein